MATVCQFTSSPSLKIETVAVLTDFSKNADLALRCAATFARGYKAKLILAHAYIPPYSAVAAPGVTLTYQTFDALQQSLKNRLINQTEAICLRDIELSILLAEGAPKDLLAELNDVDLIVVGTSGETGLEKAALGSTAETVFRSSMVPVITVGSNCRCSGAQELRFKRVLYATDFSADAAAALPYAISIASEHGAELILLHVEPDKNAHFSFERTMASEGPLAKLHELVPEYRDLRYSPKYIVGFGTPEAVIIEEAKNRNADIIVIGARGAGALASAVSHFGGGTAYRVVAKADCPVFTVRHEERNNILSRSTTAP